MAVRRSTGTVGRVGGLSTVRARAIGAALLAVCLLAATAAGPTTAAVRPSMVLKRILAGYDRPIAVVSPPGVRNRLYIVEQSGRIQTAKLTAGRWLREGTLLDLSAIVSDPHVVGSGERGLLGVAFPPDHSTSRRFYVSYTVRDPDVPWGGGDSAVAEYRALDATHADATSGRVLLTVHRDEANHNGGDIAFGPDGMLYVALGDGDGHGDPHGWSQDPGTLLGKIIRIDPLDPDGTGPETYRVPDDNPFVGQAGWRPEIWGLGLRNPWRFTFDPPTGDLWIGDAGEDRQEEIDRARAVGGHGAGRGLNWGWNICEGGLAFPGPGRCQAGTLGFAAPVLVSRRSGSRAWDGLCAVIGGRVYRGAVRAWRGMYLFGDFCTGRLIATDRSGRVRLVRSSRLAIMAIGNDGAGRLYVADATGAILSITLRGDPTP